MSDKVLDAQIYRNAVKHHRNQIRFVCHLMREGNCQADADEAGEKPRC